MKQYNTVYISTRLMLRFLFWIFLVSLEDQVSDVSLFCFAWTPRRDYDEELLGEARRQCRAPEVQQESDSKIHLFIYICIHIYIYIVCISLISICVIFVVSLLGIANVMGTCSTRIMLPPVLKRSPQLEQIELLGARLYASHCPQAECGSQRRWMALP